MKNIERNMACFSYNGTFILDTDTPESIGLKEGGLVDAW